jgi:hypothetical protein
MSKDKKKPSSAKVVIPSVLRDAAMARLDDEEGRMTLPVLYECIAPTYEGPTLLRPPGKITIAVEGAHWIVKVDFPFEGQSTRLACPSLASCLSELNSYLGSGKAVFTPIWNKSKKPLPKLDDCIQ